MTSDVKHIFGGGHTEVKLHIVRAYAKAFQNALKFQPFETWYIDPFAGTGERTQTELTGGLLAGCPIEAVEVTRDGSAKLALEVDPPFDHYRLSDTKGAHVDALQRLIQRYPHRDAVVRRSDANAFVSEVLSEPQWSDKSKGRMQRGIVFLDPYGMEVSWETLEALAKMERLDVWLLFSAKAVRQQLGPSLDRVDAGKAAALDRFFGEPDWREAFFRPPAGQYGLFGDEASNSETAVNLPAIGDYAKDRFGQIFRWVSPPKSLKVRNVSDYFQLYCMMNNPWPKALDLIQKLHRAVIKASEQASHRTSDH